MTGVLVIGAGPAGLAAAARLARAGQTVTVLERQTTPGGTPRLCGHSPFGMREFHRVMGGAAYADRLVRAATDAGAQVLTSHTVTAIAPDLTTRVATPDGLHTLHPRAILLATGVREASRAERLLPGDRPSGILTTGALQDMWFARGALPFRRPVILGHDMVAMSAILTCRQMGAAPVALIRPPGGTRAAIPFRWLPILLRLPVVRGAITDLVARDGRLVQVVLADRTINADGLVLTGDWRPEVGLARISGIGIDPVTGGPVIDRNGRTTQPGIYACGNVLRGVRTAGHCWTEGRHAANVILFDLERARR